MGEWSYRLPSDVSVTVRARRKPSLLAHFLGEEAPHEGAASLLLDLTPRKGEHARALLSVDSAGGALGIRGAYKAIPWSCRISRREQEGWTASFWSPLLREYLSLRIVLIPLLRRLLLDRGVALVCAAAFQTEGAATLLAGPNGCGKTTLLLSALEGGGGLVGDEYLGLSADAEVTPVARAPAVRRASLASTPRLLQRFSRRRRFALRIGELVALLTRGWIQPPFHVSPAELGVSAAPERDTRVGRFFWLEPREGEGSGVTCEPMDVREAVERLSVMQAAHDLWYGDPGAFLDITRGDYTGASYRLRWGETVERALADASCYRLTFPAGGPVSPEVLQRVLPRR